MTRVLLVAVADEIASKLRRGAGAADVEVVGSEIEALARVGRGAGDLAAVVLGPGCRAPIQIAQRACAADPDLEVLVLCEGTCSRDLVDAIQQAPLVGDGVRCVAWTCCKPLAGEVEGAVQRTEARRAHRRAVAALGSGAAPAAPEPPEPHADAYFGQLVDNAPIGIVVLDGRRRVVGWNLQTESLTGKSEREMLGSPLDPILADGERPRWEAFLRRAPGPHRDTFRMRVPSGLADVEITLAAVAGHRGDPGTLVLLQDVTAREQARREREAALAHLGFLAQASRVLGASLDLPITLEIVAKLAIPQLGDWCLVDLAEPGGWVDRVAVAHADPSKGALASRMQRRYPPLPHGAELGVAAALARGEPQILYDFADEKLALVARDADHLETLRELDMKSTLSLPLLARGRLVGVLTFLATTAPRTYGDLDVALASELAERAAIAVENARLYTAAQEARQRAEEASRVKDEFLAVVSHELRTPLTAILGWSRTLAARTRTPEQIERGLASIERNAVAQARIVEDILDMSRIVTGKLRLELAPVDLAGIARLALDASAATARAKGVTAELAAAEPALVLGDADRLQQVLWNLIGNAIKFTPAGGRVDVRVDGDAQAAVITVRDTGAGISREFLPYVFDRFRQADASTTRAHGGLGLGLAIVRHLVELHGGSVRAESDGAGRGAAFTITLPRLSAASPSRPAPPDRGLDPLSRTRLDGTRVLVVEDDVDTRELLVLALRERGAEVVAVGSAAEAMLALGEGPPDVLVSDLAMPGEDGLSLLRRVRALPGAASRVPALALSAYTGPADRDRALAAGFQQHLAKPVEMGALAQAIADIVAAR